MMFPDVSDYSVTREKERDYLALFASEQCGCSTVSSYWKFEIVPPSTSWELEQTTPNFELPCGSLAEVFQHLSVPASYHIVGQPLMTGPEINRSLKNCLEISYRFGQRTVPCRANQQIHEDLMVGSQGGENRAARNISLAEARTMALRAIREAEEERRGITAREAESELRLLEDE